MSQQEVDFTDDDGRIHRVTVPAGCPEDMYSEGIPVGPPSLASLELPLPIEVRLHNQLHDRGLFRKADVLRRPQELQAALQRALRLDVQTIQSLYVAEGG
ncbi:MAG: hypothetical protein Q8R28_11630 [Dehalococcoidia bacterium]|nr:hypothetical protein [Dehalococcoidia bacterium]